MVLISTRSPSGEFRRSSSASDKRKTRRHTTTQGETMRGIKTAKLEVVERFTYLKRQFNAKLLNAAEFREEFTALLQPSKKKK